MFLAKSAQAFTLAAAALLGLGTIPASAQYNARQNIPVQCYGGKNQAGLYVCACDQGWISGMAALSLGNVRVSYGPGSLQSCLQWADAKNGVGIGAPTTPPLGGGGGQTPPPSVPRTPKSTDCELIGVASTDGSGAPDRYKTGGTEVPVPVEKLQNGTELVINMRDGDLRYLTLHNRTTGGNWSTAYQGEDTRFAVGDEALEGCLKSASCTHVIVSINGAHSRYESLESSAYVQVCPATPAEDSHSQTTLTGPTSVLFDNWNGGPCSFTNTSKVQLTQPTQLTRLETYINWSKVGNTALFGELTNGFGTTFPLRFDKGNCHPTMPEFCYGVVDSGNSMSGLPSQVLPAGEWFVTTQEIAMCWNSASGGTGYLRGFGRQ